MGRIEQRYAATTYVLQLRSIARSNGLGALDVNHEVTHLALEFGHHLILVASLLQYPLLELLNLGLPLGLILGELCVYLREPRKQATVMSKCNTIRATIRTSIVYILEELGLFLEVLHLGKRLTVLGLSPDNQSTNQLINPSVSLSTGTRRSRSRSRYLNSRMFLLLKMVLALRLFERGKQRLSFLEHLAHISFDLLGL